MKTMKTMTTRGGLAGLAGGLVVGAGAIAVAQGMFQLPQTPLVGGDPVSARDLNARFDAVVEELNRLRGTIDDLCAPPPSMTLDVRPAGGRGAFPDVAAALASLEPYCVPSGRVLTIQVHAGTYGDHPEIRIDRSDGDRIVIRAAPEAQSPPVLDFALEGVILEAGASLRLIAGLELGGPQRDGGAANGVSASGGGHVSLSAVVLRDWRSAVLASHGATVNLTDVDIRHTSACVTVVDGGHADVSGLTCSATDVGVFAASGSTALLDKGRGDPPFGLDIVATAGNGIVAHSAAVVRVIGAVVHDCGQAGFFAGYGGLIDASSVPGSVTRAVMNDGHGFYAAVGGHLRADDVQSTGNVGREFLVDGLSIVMIPGACGDGGDDDTPGSPDRVFGDLREPADCPPR